MGTDGLEAQLRALPEKIMGLTYANIEVENLFSTRRMAIKALADSGAVFMIIPEHVAIQLGYDLEEVSRREVILADGSRKSVPMVGPLRVHFAGRYCDLSSLVFGDEALFGAVPMEMMDLVLHPATQTLTVNPASPFIPVALAK
jgi:clan AA aspartic protease